MPIIKVIDCWIRNYLAGDGKVINSPMLDGLSKDIAIDKITKYFNETGCSQKVDYKIRDWGVSRQRYWGCPIPVIYYEDGSYKVLDKSELPVFLPMI